MFVHEARKVGEHIVQHLELFGGHVVEARGAINFIHQRVEIGHQRRIHAAFRQRILIAVDLVAQVGDPRRPRLVPDGWRFCGVVDAPQGLKHRFAHSLRDMARIRGFGQPGNQVVRLARDGAPQARFGLGFGLPCGFLFRLLQILYRLFEFGFCLLLRPFFSDLFALCPRSLEIRSRLRQAKHAVQDIVRNVHQVFFIGTVGVLDFRPGSLERVHQGNGHVALAGSFVEQRREHRAQFIPQGGKRHAVVRHHKAPHVGPREGARIAQHLARLGLLGVG